MLQESKKKIQNYIKYLRKILKLEEVGVDPALNDTEILDLFRHCLDCGEELIASEQQMHAILEFDSPEQAFSAIYENLRSDGCQAPSEDESENNTYDNGFKILESTDILNLLKKESEETICTVGVCDGAQNLREAIEMLRGYANYLEELQSNGFQLESPIIDGHGLLQKEID